MQCATERFVGKPLLSALLLVLFKRPNYISDLDEIWYEVCIVNVLGLILLWLIFLRCKHLFVYDQ